MTAKHYAVLGGLLVSLGMHLQGASSWATVLSVHSVGELLVQIATVIGALYLTPPTAAAPAAPTAPAA